VIIEVLRNVCFCFDSIKLIILVYDI
jgi:hypothetical protein